MDHPFSGVIVRYLNKNNGAISKDSDVRDELHINLWEVSDRRFLDIGLMIHKPNEIDSIQIDLPWEFDKTKVFDLGSRLVGEKIISAIFNEVVSYDGRNDKQFATVTFVANGEKEHLFNLIRLSTHCFETEKIAFQESGPSTQLNIRLKHVPDDAKTERCYFRFRIIELPEEVYTSKFVQKDRNLLSSSIETRIVDFRVNVRRGVPDDVLTAKEKLTFPKFKKIHLFLTVDRTRELVSEGENFIACRSLEDEVIWNNYIILDAQQSGKIISVRDLLGYQWSIKSEKESDGTTKKSVKDLVALARFTHVISSKSDIFRFVILALLIGGAGNGVWEIISDKINSTLIFLGTKLPNAMLIESKPSPLTSLIVLIIIIKCYPRIQGQIVARFTAFRKSKEN